MKCILVESVISMKRIVDNLFVGVVEDIPFAEQMNYSILGACKEPLHRQHARIQGAAEEGYLTKAMPKSEKEYLFVERDHALYLNLIDARDSKYIPDAVINKALEFIDKEHKQGRTVLIVCNKAESRSPSIALMWMIKNGEYDLAETIRDVMVNFVEFYYNNYCPSNGMEDYVVNFWNKYREEYKNGKA